MTLATNHIAQGVLLLAAIIGAGRRAARASTRQCAA
jgi:hypothetical protein